MGNHRLIVYKFQYADDLVCYWPFYYETLNEVSTDTFDDEIQERITSELTKYPSLKDISIIHNKLADIEECEDTIRSVLSVHPDRDDVQIKYLQLEISNELQDEPLLNYDVPYYSKIEFVRMPFPVRVRSKNFKILLDDIELPLIVIKT
jgi:hypothetical protein